MNDLCKVESESRTVFTPAIDIHETDAGMVLTADVPGVKPGNLDVSVEDKVLKIYGRVDNEFPKDGKVVHQEYRVGDYFRSFILSDEVDADNITAALDAGVLRLTLPKTRRQPRQIQVVAG